MKLQPIWARLPIDSAMRVVLVIDASESAEDQRTRIADFVRHLLGLMPAACQPELYFLGNPDAYPADLFAARAHQWFAENCRRASLISPLMAAWGERCVQRIVVVGSGPIYDLDDWRNSPLASRLLLVSLGDSLRGCEKMGLAPTGNGENPGRTEVAKVPVSNFSQPLRGPAQVGDELSTSDAQHVLPMLYDPVATVSVTGTGFMPTWWDNPAYRLRIADGRAELLGSARENLRLTLSALIADPATLEATITRTSGHATQHPLESCAPDAEAEQNHGTLTRAEIRTLRAARRKLPFECPICGRQEAWNVVRCKQRGQILGEPVYPSVTASSGAQHPRGFVIFQRLCREIGFRIHPVPVLRIGPQRVAVANSGVCLVEYDARTQHWNDLPDPFQQYQEMNSHACAIYL
jgi:predicted RNA-binding Zn-ribbon protein involved in translation (DUF1610 family)